MTAPSVDIYLSRTRSATYDCLEFAREVWLDVTGEDLRQRLAGLFDQRHPTASEVRSFDRLSAPSDPCLVLMRHPQVDPHIGVFLRGRVLHLHKTAPEFQPLEVAAQGFATTEFFR